MSSKNIFSKFDDCKDEIKNALEKITQLKSNTTSDLTISTNIKKLLQQTEKLKDNLKVAEQDYKNNVAEVNSQVIKDIISSNKLTLDKLVVKVNKIANKLKNNTNDVK